MLIEFVVTLIVIAILVFLFKKPSNPYQSSGNQTVYAPNPDGKATFTYIDVFDIAGRGLIVVGKLESGVLKVGMKTEINGKEIVIDKNIMSLRKEYISISSQDENANEVAVLIGKSFTKQALVDYLKSNPTIVFY